LVVVVEMEILSLKGQVKQAVEKASKNRYLALPNVSLIYFDN
jgi:hypothetical protein